MGKRDRLRKERIRNGVEGPFVPVQTKSRPKVTTTTVLAVAFEALRIGPTGFLPLESHLNSKKGGP